MRHLYCFRGYYYFRSKIPKDLQDIFQCGIIKKALKTKDLKTALSSVKVLTDNFYRIVNLIRSDILNKEQMRLLARKFLDNMLNSFEDLTIRAKLYPTLETRDNRIGQYQTMIDIFKNSLPLAQTHWVERDVDELLAEESITLEKNSNDYRKLCREFTKALIQVYNIEIERIKGNFDTEYDKSLSVTPPERNPIQVSDKKGKLLSKVIAQYCKEKIDGKDWNAKNAEETQNFYKQFVEIIGDKDIKEYDRPELLDYRGLLIKFPANVNKHKVLRDLPLEEVINLIKNDDLPPCRILSIKTANKNLIRINAIFEYAVGRGYIDFNPAYKLKIAIKKKTKASEEKDPYSKDDIRKLITSPAFVKVNQERPERFWIPLIGLYSGCRLGEISQLYKSDIKEDFGIPYFDINDEEDKVLKTVSSKRLVPISPELLKLGFIDYVKSVKHERLWSNLKRRRDGYGHDFSRWYNDYEAKYITDHPKKSFNSLRHNFINQLKQEIVKEKAVALDSVLKETVGHTNESITLDRYGKDYVLQLKLELIKKLDYGIDFSHLKFPC